MCFRTIQTGDLMQPLERLFLAWFLALPLLAQAGPAPWYRWQSMVTGETVCAQHTPGPGWSRVPQAYLDARCRMRDQSAENPKSRNGK